MKLIFADPQIDVDDNLARSAQKFQGFLIIYCRNAQGLKIVPKITGERIKPDRMVPKFVDVHFAPKMRSLNATDRYVWQISDINQGIQ